MEVLLWGLAGGAVVIVIILLCVGYGKITDRKIAENKWEKHLYIQKHTDEINHCKEQFAKAENAVREKYPKRYPYQLKEKYQIYDIDEKPYAGWSGLKRIRTGMEVCCDAGNIIFLEAMQPMPDFTLFTPEELTSYEPPAFPKTLYEFPLDKIVYFREIGDVQYTTEISGGKVTGGGSSIGGAVVGGLLAGDAGAIIGSRKKIESEGITTNVVEHDSRQVVLKLTDNEMRFDIEIYDIFMDLIPEKEYTYIMATKSGKEEQKKSTVEQLKDAKEMLDAGMITEDEFAAIKAELLPAKSK